MEAPTRAPPLHIQHLLKHEEELLRVCSFMVMQGDAETHRSLHSYSSKAQAFPESQPAVQR